MFRSTARFYASFHLIEQPIDGFWSAGATPLVAIARMASTSSRDAPSRGGVTSDGRRREQYRKEGATGPDAVPWLALQQS